MEEDPPQSPPMAPHHQPEREQESGHETAPVAKHWMIGVERGLDIQAWTRDAAEFPQEFSKQAVIHPRTAEPVVAAVRRRLGIAPGQPEDIAVLAVPDIAEYDLHARVRSPGTMTLLAGHDDEGMRQALQHLRSSEAGSDPIVMMVSPSASTLQKWALLATEGAGAKGAQIIVLDMLHKNEARDAQAMLTQIYAHWPATCTRKLAAVVALQPAITAVTERGTNTAVTVFLAAIQVRPTTGRAARRIVQEPTVQIAHLGGRDGDQLLVVTSAPRTQDAVKAAIRSLLKDANASAVRLPMPRSVLTMEPYKAVQHEAVSVRGSGHEGERAVKAFLDAVHTHDAYVWRAQGACEDKLIIVHVSERGRATEVAAALMQLVDLDQGLSWWMLTDTAFVVRGPNTVTLGYIKRLLEARGLPVDDNAHLAPVCLRRQSVETDCEVWSVLREGNLEACYQLELVENATREEVRDSMAEAEIYAPSWRMWNATVYTAQGTPAPAVVMATTCPDTVSSMENAVGHGRPVTVRGTVSRWTYHTAEVVPHRAVSTRTNPLTSAEAAEQAARIERNQRGNPKQAMGFMTIPFLVAKDGARVVARPGEAGEVVTPGASITRRNLMGRAAGLRVRPWTRPIHGDLGLHVWTTARPLVVLDDETPDVVMIRPEESHFLARAAPAGHRVLRRATDTMKTEMADLCRDSGLTLPECDGDVRFIATAAKASLTPQPLAFDHDEFRIVALAMWVNGGTGVSYRAEGTKAARPPRIPLGLHTRADRYAMHATSTDGILVVAPPEVWTARQPRVTMEGCDVDIDEEYVAFWVISLTPVRGNNRGVGSGGPPGRPTPGPTDRGSTQRQHNGTGAPSAHPSHPRRPPPEPTQRDPSTQGRETGSGWPGETYFIGSPRPKDAGKRKDVVDGNDATDYAGGPPVTQLDEPEEERQAGVVGGPEVPWFPEIFAREVLRREPHADTACTPPGGLLAGGAAGAEEPDYRGGAMDADPDPRHAAVRVDALPPARGVEPSQTHGSPEGLGEGAGLAGDGGGEPLRTAQRPRLATGATQHAWHQGAPVGHDVSGDDGLGPGGGEGSLQAAGLTRPKEVDRDSEGEGRLEEPHRPWGTPAPHHPGSRDADAGVDGSAPSSQEREDGPFGRDGGAPDSEQGFGPSGDGVFLRAGRRAGLAVGGAWSDESGCVRTGHRAADERTLDPGGGEGSLQAAGRRCPEGNDGQARGARERGEETEKFHEGGGGGSSQAAHRGTPPSSPTGGGTEAGGAGPTTQYGPDAGADRPRDARQRPASHAPLYRGPHATSGQALAAAGSTRDEARTGAPGPRLREGFHAGAKYADRARYLVLISLFDGTHTAREAVTEEIGRPPDMVVACEIDMQERALVAAKYGYPLTGGTGHVRKTKDGVLVMYLTNVWLLLSKYGELLKRAFSHVPQEWRDRVTVLAVSGSPCQDLTTATKGGAAGFAGGRSVHFHVLPILVYWTVKLYPHFDVILVGENAGSMKPHMAAYLAEVMGLPSTGVNVRDSGNFAITTRRRTWYSNLPVGAGEPQFDPNGIIDEGWWVAGRPVRGGYIAIMNREDRDINELHRWFGQFGTVVEFSEDALSPRTDRFRLRVRLESFAREDAPVEAVPPQGVRVTRAKDPRGSLMPMLTTTNGVTKDGEPILSVAAYRPSQLLHRVDADGELLTQPWRTWKILRDKFPREFPRLEKFDPFKSDRSEELELLGVAKYIAENAASLGVRAMNTRERMKDADMGDFFVGMPEDIARQVGPEILVRMTGNIFRRRALCHVLRGDGRGASLKGNVNISSQGQQWHPPKPSPMEPLRIREEAFPKLVEIIRAGDTQGEVAGSLVSSPYPVDKDEERRLTGHVVHWQAGVDGAVQHASRMSEDAQAPLALKLVLGAAAPSGAPSGAQGGGGRARRDSGSTGTQPGRQARKRAASQGPVAGPARSGGRGPPSGAGGTEHSRDEDRPAAQRRIGDYWPALGGADGAGPATDVPMAGDGLDRDPGRGAAGEAHEKGGDETAEGQSAHSGGCGGGSSQAPRDRGAAGCFTTIGHPARRQWAADNIGMSRTRVAATICGEDSCLVETLGMLVCNVEADRMPEGRPRSRWIEKVHGINTTIRRMFDVPDGQGLDVDMAPWIINTWMDGVTPTLSVYVIETSHEVDGHYMYLDAMRLLTPAKSFSIAAIHYAGQEGRAGGHYAPLMPGPNRNTAILHAPPGGGDIPLDLAQYSCPDPCPVDDMLEAAGARRLRLPVPADRADIARMVVWIWLTQAGMAEGAPASLESQVVSAVKHRRAPTEAATQQQVAAVVGTALKRAKTALGGHRGQAEKQLPGFWLIDVRENRILTAAGAASDTPPVVLVKAEGQWWPVLHSPTWSLQGATIARRSMLREEFARAGFVRLAGGSC